jgi:hypothetical protein
MIPSLSRRGISSRSSIPIWADDAMGVETSPLQIHIHKCKGGSRTAPTPIDKEAGDKMKNVITLTINGTVVELLISPNEI